MYRLHKAEEFYCRTELIIQNYFDKMEKWSQNTGTSAEYYFSGVIIICKNRGVGITEDILLQKKV